MATCPHQVLFVCNDPLDRGYVGISFPSCSHSGSSGVIFYTDSNSTCMFFFCSCTCTPSTPAVTQFDEMKKKYIEEFQNVRLQWSLQS